MMRSMFSGVSGLRAHQNRMDVVGNNIANVNTVAFKSSRVTFQEVFTQTIRGASSPDSATGRGGTNPMQVGLGISVASIDTIFTRGSLQRTDNPTDLAIEGEGFFIARGSSADTYQFTRAGNFGIDKHGNLVNPNGLRVYGWHHRVEGSKTEFDAEQEIQPINIFRDDENGNKRIIPASHTSRVAFSGNLNSSYVALSSNGNDLNSAETHDIDDIQTALDSTPGLQTFAVPYTIYDKLGNDHTITLTFVKNDANANKSEWFWYAADVLDENNDPLQGFLMFNEDGQVVQGDPHDTSPLQTIIPPLDSGTDKFDVVFDFTSITQFRGDGSVKAMDVNGYRSGEFVTMNVGSDGLITAIYSNGEQQAVGQIALAYFENPSGLQKTGGNLYIPTTNSGDFDKGLKPGSAGVGTLNPGTLEMSNVDLSREFTEMITTQRGFQANSRIITTSDEMLQELVNLKR